VLTLCPFHFTKHEQEWRRIILFYSANFSGGSSHVVLILVMVVVIVVAAAVVASLPVHQSLCLLSTTFEVVIVFF
jgi:hypothetical protein